MGRGTEESRGPKCANVINMWRQCGGRGFSIAWVMLSSLSTNKVSFV